MAGPVEASMPNNSHLKAPILIATGVLLLAVVPQCRRSAPAEPDGPAPVPTRTEPKLQFPIDLTVEDDSVNEFVTHAMLTATSGDYEAFRLLWSAREEPMPREEFLQGWDAVQQVRVRALQKIVISAEHRPEGFSDTDTYAVYVEVALDPEHRAAKEKATREAILVLVREGDRWALMRAPKAVRDWLRGKVAADSEPRQPLPPQMDALLKP